MEKKKPSWRSVAAGVLALLIVSGNLPAVSPLSVRADATTSDVNTSDDFKIENGVLTEYNGSSKDVVIPEGVTVIGDGKNAIFGPTIESVTIPSSVTKIADNAFNTCTGLKSITFAEGSQLKKIGESAFYAANQLESLTIPEGVTSIGDHAFVAMTQLRSITFPSTLESVCGGNWFGNLFAFSAAMGAPTNLTAVNFNDGNANYSSHDGVVYSADGKTLIYCPAAKKELLNWADGVETIASDAFRKSNLTGIVIPEGVVTIEASAFNGTNATSVKFPSTLKTIGDSAFYISKLKSIEFSEGLETIGTMAFGEVCASGSISITLPATLKSVGSAALDCLADSGATVTITVLGKETVLSNGFIANSANYTLRGYKDSTAEAYASDKSVNFELIGESTETAVESVTLPGTLELKVGENSQLTATVLPENADDKSLTWSSSDDSVATVDDNGNVTAVSAGNATITATSSNGISASCEVTVAVQSDFVINNGVLTAYTGSSKNVVIPSGVTVVGDGKNAIFGSAVESVTIPASVTEIADYAFNLCTGLTSITFEEGSSLEKIGDSAFYAPNKVKNLVIPEGVKSIGQYAFVAMNSLESITFPSTLEAVGGTWFGDLFSRGSSGSVPAALTAVNFNEGNAKYSSHDGVVYSADKKTLIYCPAAKTSITSFANGVEAIGSNAFRKSKLTSVSIPASVKTIGSSAFFFSQVSNLILSEGLERIEDNAFMQSRVAQVTIPASVKYIGENAFDFENGDDYHIRLLGAETKLADDFIPYYVSITVYAPSGSTAESYVSAKKAALGERCKLTFSSDGFIEATSIALDKTSLELYRRQTAKLTASVEPSDAKFTVSWSSSDNSIATVDKDGNVTAVQTGNVTITASVGNLSASCAVSVIRAEGESDFLVNTSGEITGFIGADASELVIPSEVNGVTVTSIAAGAFKDDSDIKSVTLPDGLTSIGANAFDGCASLESINLENVTSIGDGAFNSCSSLKSVTLGEGLTVIPESAFASCPQLASVTLPSTLKEIGKNAFAICSSLGSIELPDGLEIIHAGAFKKCPLTSFRLPAALKQLGDKYMGDVFEEPGELRADTNLKNITIDENNPYWTAQDGLLYSKDMKTIVFCPRGRVTAKVADGVTEIGRYAFFMCFDLTTVELPSSLKVVSEQAFHYCEALTDCVLPDGLERIEDSGFFGCEEWTGVDSIPSSVNFIGDYAFNECKGSKIVIPEGITAVPKFAFWGYEETLTEIVIPSTVRTIGDSAFAWAKNVTKLTIPEGVTSIGSESFGRMDGLTELTLPSTLRSIGEKAFMGGSSVENKLAEVYIPASVNEIASDAFENRPGLVIVTDNSYTAAAKYARENGFELRYRDADADFEIVDGVLIAYHGTSTEIVIPSTVTEIGEEVFVVEEGEEGTEITKVTIPASVRKIGKSAFEGCQLTEVIFEGENLREIGESAFAYCTKLPAITLPEGLEIIGNGAFQGASAIESINIPSTVVSIGDSAFSTCVGLKEVNFADDLSSGLKTIGYQAFYQCTRVSTFDIPEGVEKIGDQALRAGRGLKRVYLPSTLTELGSSAPAVFLDARSSSYSGTDSLVSITVAENNPVYSSNDGLLYSADGSELLFCPSGITGTVKVADGTKTIGRSAFIRAGADHVILPESLETIAPSAFSGSGFTSVEIPDNVKTIGDSAFFNCSKLKSVKLGNSVETIGDYAFSLVPLDNITLPASVISVGDDAFDELNNHIRVENPATDLGSSIPNSAITVYGHSNSTAEKYVSDARAKYGENCRLTFMSIDSFVEVTSITLDKTTITLKQRKTGQLTATVSPENATHTELVYKSLNSKVATVDASGLITAVAPGTTVIRVLSTDGVYADCTVMVEADENYSDFRVDERGYITGYDGESADIIIPNVVQGKIVVGIAEGAFKGVNGIESVTIPDSVKEIEKEAFLRCSDLVRVGLGKVEIIGDNAFEYCQHIKEIVLPEGLTSLGDHAFASCDALESVSIPSTLEEIPDGAFHTCWRLRDVVIPEGVVTVGEEAFYECEGMYSLTLPNSLRRIKKGAFAACVRLTRVVVPEGVEAIEAQAFMSCVSLTTIHLPATLREMGGEYPGDVFETTEVLGCTGLTSVTVTGQSDYFSAKDGLLYSADGSTLLFVPRGLTDVEVPEGVEKIGDHAFFYCRALESVSLPSTLREIRNNSFGICDNLSSIVIPEGVTILGDSAFANAGKLSEITLPKTLKSIGANAFSGTSLGEIVVPENVTTIGDSAFSFISDLKKAVILSGVTNIGSGLFRTTPDVTIYTDSKTAPIYSYALENGIPVIVMEKEEPGDSGMIYPILEFYEIEIIDSEGGEVSADRSRAMNGSKVTLTVEPDEGYELALISVIGKSGNVTLDGYSFRMPASDVKVLVEFAKSAPAFDDVDEDAYYANAVDWAVRNGITNGISDGIFAPDSSCTRAQAVTFLWRAAGSPVVESKQSFKDVEPDDYFFNAVSWAVENGITNGIGDDLFAPDAPCTRGQIVTFLHRAAGNPAVGESGFKDVDKDAYFADAVSWAVDTGVTNGVGDNLFAPDEICTRAQIVTFLYRYYG